MSQWNDDILVDAVKALSSVEQRLRRGKTLTASSTSSVPRPASTTPPSSTPPTYTAPAPADTTPSSSNTSGGTSSMSSGDPSLQSVTLPDGTQASVAGNSNYTPPAAPPPKPAGGQGILGTIGTIVSVASLVFAKVLSKFSIPGLGNGMMLNGGMMLSLVGMGLAAYNTWNALGDLFKNPSWSTFGQFALAGGSLFAATLGFFMSTGLPFMVSLGPAGLVTLGIIAIMAFFSWLFGDRSPSKHEKNLTEFPPVWANGPILFITAGMALTSAGINMSPSAPMLQSVTPAIVVLMPALVNSKLTTPDGAPMGSQFSRYNTIFVQQGDSGQPAKVMIVSPTSDTRYDEADIYSIRNNLKVAAPNGPYFIPFIVNDHPNPQAVQAMRAQNALARAAPYLKGSQGPTAVQQASAINKAGSPVK